MKYLLDTNICIYLLNGDKSLEKKVKETGVFSLAISNATLAELYFGAYNSKRIEENIKRIKGFKNILQCILTVKNQQRFSENLNPGSKLKAEL